MAVTNRHVTVLRNTSGASRYFGYIPPHGRTLANGDDVQFQGDIYEILGRPGYKLALTSFLNDITAKRIEVLQTPTVVAWDATAGKAAELIVDNGSADISYVVAGGSYEGSAPNPS